MELASLVVSIIALLGGLVGYILHDRKLKKQEARLNDLQVTELETAQSNRKKADVRMQTVYLEKGRGLLRLFNQGEADAYNIKWNFQDPILEKIPKQGEYEHLLPGQDIGLSYIFLSREDDTTNVTISWEDNFSKNNTVTITLFALNRTV